MSSKIPADISERIAGLKSQLGQDVGDELEKVVAEIFSRLELAARSNPTSASAMFLARPTGYVD